MRVSQASTTGGSSAYGTNNSTSPALHQSRVDAAANARRHSEMPRSSVNPSYDHHYRRISTPYEQQGPASAYSLAPGQNIPSISGLTQNPSMGSSSGSPAMLQHPISDQSRNAGSTAAMDANSRHSATCCATNERNPAQLPSRTVRDVVQVSIFPAILCRKAEKVLTWTRNIEFTRTTARNGHLAHDKCTKQRRPSDDDDNHHTK
nr:hypothetical protein CFP56_38848 [Quercus suber]